MLKLWGFWLVFCVITGCSQSTTPPDDIPPAFFLLDPDIRDAFETTWETQSLPLFRRQETLRALQTYLRQRNVRASTRLWQRVLKMLPVPEAMQMALDALQQYPGKPPVPSREDATAAELIRFVNAHIVQVIPQRSTHLWHLYQEILKRIEPFPNIVDFRFEVRKAIIDALSQVCQAVPKTDDMFVLLLRFNLPAWLRSRTLASIGICGFEDPQLVEWIIEDLFRIRDRSQLGAFARTALSGARGKARKKLLDATRRILSDPAWHHQPPFEVLRTLHAPLHRKDFAPEVFRDFSTVPRAFARLLVDLGERSLATELLQIRYTIANRKENASESFDALWETLMEIADVSDEWLLALTKGSDTSLRAVTLDALQRKCHDTVISQLYAEKILMNVSQTEYDWLNQFRDAALRNALTDKTRSMELTKRWNRETSEEQQWSATRELWSPFVKVPGENTTSVCVENDPFEGMSPREWLQLRLALTLWVCRKNAQELPPSVDFLRKQVTALEITLPWDIHAEERRKTRAMACLQEHIQKLQTWENHELQPCHNTVNCLWQRIQRGTAWPPEARNRALRRIHLAADTAFWAHFDTHFQQVPYALAEPVLQWAAPFLSRLVRYRIRDNLQKNCQDNSRCFSLWLYAIRLANEPEVSP